jgi:CBS domain-containing protein/CheY-like chemotaxis protein
MSAKEKILLVDDDDDFVRSMTDLLEAHGYRVISANNGEAGLELAKRDRPDLMVLDVMMATKTEGFEIARRIPACPELRNMPVLLVTGIRSEMKLGFRLEPDETWLPVSRIMEKPIDPSTFVAAVGELLRRRGEMDFKHGVKRLIKGILAEKESDLHTVAPETTVYQAVQLMDKHRISALLVIEEGKLVGICTERDCTRGVILQDRLPKSTPVSQIMTAPVICISPDDTTEECMSLMTHKRIRHLPVMDGGRLVGIISIGDVVRAAVAEKNFMIEQLESFITAG